MKFCLERGSSGRRDQSWDRVLRSWPVDLIGGRRPCNTWYWLQTMAEKRVSSASPQSSDSGGVDGAKNPNLWALVMTAWRRCLSAYIDSDMSMTTHINHLVRTCFYNHCRINHIRRFITTKTAILLVNRFVIFRVDYCNSLLAGLPNCHLHRIQLVLNVAARLLYRGQKRDHFTPLLHDKLHWLPIAARIQFKICLLTYKSLHGLAPQYIADFFKPVASVLRRSTLRSASNESLIIPATKTAFGTRAFSVTGPTYWNQLPETVKNAATVNTFKRHLKTYLFKLSYFS